MQQEVLGVDVGGTAIKTWGGDGAGPAVPTPAGDPTGERTADAVAALVAARSAPVAALGVAVPGIVDDAAGVCRYSVNLGWRDVPVRALLTARTGLPVVVTHDVRAGGVAEQTTGAGAGTSGALLFVALGTGLALALIDGAGRPTASGWAGEVGQLRYPASGPFAGLRVEEVASAGGLAARFGAPDAATVLAARTAGDPRAAACWDDTVEALAEVLAWSVAVAAPSTVVIGGGLALAGEALLAPLRAALRLRLGPLPEPLVLAARHGSTAGAVGAARLAADLLATARTEAQQAGPGQDGQDRQVGQAAQDGEAAQAGLDRQDGEAGQAVQDDPDAQRAQPARPVQPARPEPDQRQPAQFGPPTTTEETPPR